MEALACVEIYSLFWMGLPPEGKHVSKSKVTAYHKWDILMLQCFPRARRKLKRWSQTKSLYLKAFLDQNLFLLSNFFPVASQTHSLVKVMLAGTISWFKHDGVCEKKSCRKNVGLTLMLSVVLKEKQEGPIWKTSVLLFLTLKFSTRLVGSSTFFTTFKRILDFTYLLWLWMQFYRYGSQEGNWEA